MARRYFKRGSPASIIEGVQEENKKRKKSPSNTSIDENSKIDTGLDPEDAYEHVLTGERVWYSEAAVRKIFQQLVEYCTTEETCLIISQFFNKKYIPKNIWMIWLTKYPFAQKTYDLCMNIIANRREVGMSFGKLDRIAQMRVLHMYNPDWDAANKYWATMKKLEGAVENTGNITVIIPNTPSVDSVPPRKTQHEQEAETAPINEQSSAT